jgi:hypothetical protein
LLDGSTDNRGLAHRRTANSLRAGMSIASTYPLQILRFFDFLPKCLGKHLEAGHFGLKQLDNSVKQTIFGLKQLIRHNDLRRILRNTIDLRDIIMISDLRI